MEIQIFILFIISILLIGILEIRINHSIKFLDFFLILFFIFIVTLRPEKTPDTSAYAELFKSYSASTIKTLSEDSFWESEFCFVLLSNSIKLIFGNNVKIFFAIIAIMNLLLLYRSSKIIITKALNEDLKISLKGSDIPSAKSKNNLILIAPLFGLYVTYYGLMYSGIVLRAGLAISFIILAYSKAFIGKYTQSIFLLLISFAFHKTALIGALIIPVGLIKLNFNKKIYFTIWIILSALYISKITLYLAVKFSKFISVFLIVSESKTSSLLGNYLTKEIFYNEYSFMVIVMLINISISIYYLNGTFIYRSLLNICLLGLTLQVLFGSIFAFSRISDFFLFVSFILFYLALNNYYYIANKYFLFAFIIITNSIFFIRLAGI